MTDTEWLASSDPQEMLGPISSTASERKCRLLVCAFLRAHSPDAEHSAGASVALGERWADGDATEAEVRAFKSAAPLAYWAALTQSSRPLLLLCANALGDSWRIAPALFREFFGNPFRPLNFDPGWRTADVLNLAQPAYEHRILPSGHLDNARLAVLADALEDAGCTDTAILKHLRSPGPHVRGCWPVDLILGKS
jgi:hypothetical protein